MVVGPEAVIQQFTNSMVLFGYYSLIAVGLTLIFGTLGIVNFAHGEFVMVGSFVTYFLFVEGIPYMIALAAAFLIAFILGGITEKAVIHPVRDNVLNTLLVTLGLFLVMRSGARILFGVSTYTLNAPWNDISFSIIGNYELILHRVIIVIASLLMIGLLHAWITRTKSGMIIRAVAEDELTAAIQGVNTDRYMLLTFCIGTGLAGLSGGLIAPLISISYVVGVWPILVSFVIITIGGMGSYKGALGGALIVSLIEGMSALFVSSTVSRILIFLLMFLFLVFKPQGLANVEGVSH